MTEKSFFAGKRVLITGISGTVGQSLRQRIATFDVSEIVGIDNNESQLFLDAQENPGQFRPVLGDIRDSDTLYEACKGVDFVFHLAALKHVPLCESNPLEAVRTNILGVKNLIDAACARNVEKILNTSTDKVVNPFNVMGTSKLMGEQLVRAANLVEPDTRFFSTRFGNVLGSRGSVVPIFRAQIKAGIPVTLTSRDMTRFVMTLDEAISLIVDSMTIAAGGEVFVTKMKAIRVEELAEVMIEDLSPNGGKSEPVSFISETGARPGEKLFEELMTTEEARRSLESSNYYTIFPALTDIYDQKGAPNIESLGVDVPYNSSVVPPMSKDELREYLQRNNLL